MVNKCPYCSTDVNETDIICPNCHNELAVRCPYCKQEIRAYDETCPNCNTKLRRKNEAETFIILTMVLNAIWIIGSIFGIFMIIISPQIIAVGTSKGGLDAIEAMLKLGIWLFVVVAVPYIIAIIKHYQMKLAIAGLVINFILAIMFMISFVGLFFTVALAK